MKYFFISLCAMLFADYCAAQKVYQGFPSDIRESRVIFLEYEMLEVNKDLPSHVRNKRKARNKDAEKANKQLRQELIKSPIAYTISNRSEYRDLNGYKYAFDSNLLRKANQGLQDYSADEVRAGKGFMYCYLLDMETGDKYMLFTVPYNWPYHYKGIMSNFYKELKKAN